MSGVNAISMQTFSQVTDGRGSRKCLVDSSYLEHDSDKEVRNRIMFSTIKRYVCSAKNVQKIIPSDHKELLRSLVRFKDGMEGVMGYDHIQVPPVYKQVIPIFKTLFSFFRCASISCTDHRISLTDSLIETGDWQFCMFDSYFTCPVQYKL